MKNFAKLKKNFLQIVEKRERNFTARVFENIHEENINNLEQFLKKFQKGLK